MVMFDNKMCILFLYTKPMVEDGEYRVILASNRDEIYTRPAQPLATWIDNPVIMGGRDMEPGKEGGTWLAMGLHGRISILLNILQGKSPLNKGRGNIVSSCLSNKSETTETFLENFRKEIYQYNPFNLITVQIQKDTIDVYKLSNKGSISAPLKHPNGFLAIGNHELGKPLQKVTVGKTKFQEIVQMFGTEKLKEDLIEHLLLLLKSKDRHYPDPFLDQAAPHMSAELKEKMSSIFVRVPEKHFGTRTQTLIFVGKDNIAEYHEWTMNEPIEIENPVWAHNMVKFKINYNI